MNIPTPYSDDFKRGLDALAESARRAVTPELKRTLAATAAAAATQYRQDERIMGRFREMAAPAASLMPKPDLTEMREALDSFQRYSAEQFSHLLEQIYDSTPSLPSAQAAELADSLIEHWQAAEHEMDGEFHVEQAVDWKGVRLVLAWFLTVNAGIAAVTEGMAGGAGESLALMIALVILMTSGALGEESPQP